MNAHDHRTHVEGCYRCELSRDELDPRFDVHDGFDHCPSCQAAYQAKGDTP